MRTSPIYFSIVGLVFEGKKTVATRWGVKDALLTQQGPIIALRYQGGCYYLPGQLQGSSFHDNRSYTEQLPQEIQQVATRQPHNQRGIL